MKTLIVYSATLMWTETAKYRIKTSRSLSDVSYSLQKAFISDKISHSMANSYAANMRSVFNQQKIIKIIVTFIKRCIIMKRSKFSRKFVVRWEQNGQVLFKH